MADSEFIKDIWEVDNREDGTRVELMNFGDREKDDIWITIGHFSQNGDRQDGLTVELTREDLKRLRDVLGKILD